MSRKPPHLALLIVVFVAAAVSGNESSAPSSATTVADGAPVTIPVGLDALPSEALGPMDQEIAELLRVEKQELARLDEEFRSATDARTALAVQKRIRDLKIGTELGILEIQVRYARLEGRIDVAERLEESIHRIEDGSEAAEIER